MVNDPNLENPSEKENVSVATLISSLDQELSKAQVLGLRFLIPHAHRGVSFREAAKDILVYAFYLIRNSFWHLAKQMHKEVCSSRVLVCKMSLQKKIKNPELMFHMTLSELEQLIHSPNQQIVARHTECSRLLYFPFSF